MTIKTTIATLTLVMLASCAGCSNVRTFDKSQLDGVHKAALKIQARTAVGINQMEYPQVVSDLAYELLLARDLGLSTQDTEAIKHYTEALETYVAAKEVWKAHTEYENCLERFSYDLRFCRERPAVKLDAETLKRAHVNADVIASSNAVQTVWEVAEQEVRTAEQIRLGHPPPLPEKAQVH